MLDTSKNLTLITAGGRIRCRRCLAKSKRTQKQCDAPAIKGKNVCLSHGGRSTGPKTTEGLSRCSDTKTIHGREKRTIRDERSRKSAELHTLLEIGNSIDLFNPKATLRGRKPKTTQQLR